MTYKAPVRDQLFVLRDVLEVEKYQNLKGFAEAPLDVIEEVLTQGARFCEDVLAPLNRVGDKEGCTWRQDNTVTTPTGFKEAYRTLVDNGWLAMGVSPEHGGMGLPRILGVAYSEMSSAANMAFSMYPGLTQGAYSAINAAGSPEQRDLYCRKLATGEWGGTMNLTEPHCGTDLGMLRTKAVPNGDGSYKITGQKIWISGGEHDMADNIVHLVLARIEGAPEGVKGISLFIVPKFLPNEDGAVGPRNEGVKCAGLEEKMGIHGNATCVMSYEDAKGWLVGGEKGAQAAGSGGGLKMMFVMMNVARLGVGLQGLGQGDAAYQAALEFAKERLQGRSLTGIKNPDGPADPIIVHPDIRRMLMDSKAVLEGARAFLLWSALQADLSFNAEDPEVKQKAQDYMGLMTPVLKAYLTDKGFQICSNAMQVHGGSGFTEHFPVSQYLRDARIGMIYEGTNGIQALDLVGRKLAAGGGRAVMTFFLEIDQFVADHPEAEMKVYVDGLASVKAQLQEATMWLMQNGLANPDNAAAASVDYLHLFGLTMLAYMWALSAKTALAKIAAGDADPFYKTKLATGRYFVQRVLPDAGSHLEKLKTGAEPVMALEAEAF